MRAALAAILLTLMAGLPRAAERPKLPKGYTCGSILILYEQAKAQGFTLAAMEVALELQGYSEEQIRAARDCLPPRIVRD